MWFYEATVGTPCLAFISETWNAYCELFYVSDRDISRVLSFIKVKHNGEIGRLELRSSGFVKMANNAVTLALCYFDIFFAVFFVYSVWVICFVLVSPRIAVWHFLHSGVFCAR